jgi:hypothetical protein
MYKCDHCPYKTSVKCNFLRHLKRKRTCLPSNYNVVHCYEKVVPSGNDDRVLPDYKVVPFNDKVVRLETSNILGNFTCHKCCKELSSKQSLNLHILKCNGLSKLQCETCHKFFSNKNTKYKHKRSVNCTPHPSIQLHNGNENEHVLSSDVNEGSINNTKDEQRSKIFNNHGHITNNNNCTNNNNFTTNNNTYNITLNSFGSEDVWKIMQDKDISERIKWNLLNESKYAIARAVPEVFFNDKYPENKTIKKLVKNDGMVEVHTGDNQWETRLTKDTIGVIGGKINAILEYIVQNSSFNERDKRKLFKFGEYSSYFEFLDVIGDIEDKVGKEYDDPPENEKKRFQRELGKLIGDIIYKESMKII